MKTLTDTRIEIELLQRTMLRDATPAKKLAMVGQMTETVRQLAMAGLRSRFPDDSPQLLRRRFADLIIGKDLAMRVYGPLTDDQ